jgi:transcriptional regulator with XRE-family HTH domain
MPDLNDIARTVAQERKRLRMTQHELASKARVSRLLVARLETERLPELGVKKLIRILNALGMDIRITSLNQRRPTLEDLRAEEEGETS